MVTTNFDVDIHSWYTQNTTVYGFFSISLIKRAAMLALKGLLRFVIVLETTVRILQPSLPFKITKECLGSNRCWWNTGAFEMEIHRTDRLTKQ